MPSLLGTTVTTNYLKTAPSTQFGTRELTTIKVLVGGTNASMILVDGSTSGNTGYLSSNSLYSAAVRALQGFAEVYAVYTPVATGFIAIIAADTADGSEVATPNTQAATFGKMEAAIKASIQQLNAQTDATVAVSVPTIAIGTTL
jgi:hypothetical protein